VIICQLIAHLSLYKKYKNIKTEMYVRGRGFYEVAWLELAQRSFRNRNMF